MDRRLKIGIAGAGIGGLGAAALLAGRGHRVEVFDRFPEPQPVGSGLVIQPAGQAVLALAGAGEAALAAGARVWRMEGREARTGRRVLAVDYGPEGGDRFGLAIHRAALFGALFDAARAAGAEIEPGREVIGGEPGRISFVDGSSRGPFDLVIDASGTRSPLSGLTARPLPFGAVWGTVPWPDDCALPEGQLTQRYRLASNMVGIMPCGQVPGGDGPHATIFWSLPSDRFGDWRERGREAWLAEVEALWPDAMPFFEQIRSTDEMAFASYGHGTLRNPVGDRLAIIGDAAHRASPQLGQGANMALLDAAALALALDRWPVAEALGHYARARRWHVRVYQGMSALFTPQYQSQSRWLPVLRDRALFPLSQVPPLPRVLTRLVCGDLLPPLASLGDHSWNRFPTK